MTSSDATPEMTAEKALGEAISDHGPSLRAYLRKRGLGDADANETANDSFLKYWRARLKRKIQDPKSFIFRIARNLLISRFRASQAEKRIGDTRALSLNDEGNQLIATVLEDQKFDVRREVTVRELHDAIDDALESLSDRRHDVFAMCMLDGKSRQEVATELKISVAAVMTELSRAKRDVRKKLKKNYGAVL